jgi:hypothetical protein
MTDVFDDEDDVRGWMQTLAAMSDDAGPLPDARELWWKAELLARWDAQRRAVAPLERAEPINLGIGLAGAAVLVALLWKSVSTPSSVVILTTIVSLTLLAATTAFTLRRS